MDTLLYGTVFVSQSTHLCSQTLFRMCTCISPCTSLSIVMWNHRCPLCGAVYVSQSPHFCICTCIYVHLVLHVCSTPYAQLHGNMGFSVWHCVYCSHPTSVPTPCLECVYALVHVLMWSWVQNAAPPLCVVIWQDGFPCVTQWVCSSSILLVPHLV